MFYAFAFYDIVIGLSTYTLAAVETACCTHYCAPSSFCTVLASFASCTLLFVSYYE